MKITPIEIRQKDFQKAFRGYEKEEVDAFLLSLSQEWERVLDESKDISRRLDQAEKEVTRLRDVESSLFRTLKTAEDTGNNLIDQANKTAELHLKEAQMNAEALLNEARFKAKTIVEDAEMEVKAFMDALVDEIKNLEREYQYLEHQRENLLGELNTLMKDIKDKVERSASKANKENFQQIVKEVKNYSSDKKTKPLTETPAPVTTPVTKITNDVPVKNTPEPKKQSGNDKSDETSFFDTI